jgi:hypothetical protein
VEDFIIPSMGGSGDLQPVRLDLMSAPVQNGDIAFGGVAGRVPGGVLRATASDE